MKGSPVLVSVVTIVTLLNAVAISIWLHTALQEPSGFWSDPAAAWIQAIGTIDALLIAAIVATWQRWSEQQDERTRRNITATAFSLSLVPQLQIIVDDLEQAVDAVNSALNSEPEAEIDLNYVEFQPTGPAIEFIYKNWQTIAGFNEDIVRAIVSGVEFIRMSRRLPSWEEGFSFSINDGDPQNSRRLVFDSAQRARRFAILVKLAMEQLNKAIDEIHVARSGEPRTVIVVDH